MHLVENWWTELHRLWSIRASIALGVFLGVSSILSAFTDTINPWLLCLVAIVVNGFAIPILRLVKQREKKPESGDE